MAERDLTWRDLQRIVEIVKSTASFREFHLRHGDIEIRLERVGGPASAAVESAAPVISGPADAAGPMRVDEGATPGVPQGDVVTPGVGTARSVATAPGAAAAARADGHVVRSPMVGTFYRAPAPGEAPFVEVGSRVAADTVVCIIEVMKLMNSIPAGVAGVVKQVLVGDAAAVEYGQPLVVVAPDASGPTP